MKLFIILLLSFSGLTYAQKTYSLKDSNVKIIYSIVEEESYLHIDITILNESIKDIYLPKLMSDELNFFTHGSRIYLFYGATFSLLGEPHPNIKIPLKKVKSNSEMVYSVNIEKSSDSKIIVLGFEYLDKIKSNEPLVDYLFFKEKRKLLYGEFNLGCN